MPATAPTRVTTVIPSGRSRPQPRGRGRRALWLAALAAAVLASTAIGCSAPSTDGPGNTTGDTSAARTVDSAYGNTTITGQVHRVVALSADWLGTMLALHAPVVGYKTDGPAAQMAPAPWLADSLPADATRLSGSGDGIVEKVAALEPDLIVGPTWLVTRELADKLGVLAPTIVDDDSGAGTTSGSWERQLATAGTALGSPSAATRDAVNARITAAAQRHRAVAGKTFGIAVAGGGGQLALTSSADASASKFLGALGLRLVTIPGTAGQQRTVVSAENARELDRAFLLIVGSTPAGVGDIDAFIAQRPAGSPVLKADLPLLNAFNIPDASSIPTLLAALDRVLPA